MLLSLKINKRLWIAATCSRAIQPSFFGVRTVVMNGFGHILAPDNTKLVNRINIGMNLLPPGPIPGLRLNRVSWEGE